MLVLYSVYECFQPTVLVLCSVNKRFQPTVLVLYSVNKILMFSAYSADIAPNERMFQPTVLVLYSVYGLFWPTVLVLRSVFECFSVHSAGIAISVQIDSAYNVGMCQGVLI